MSIQWKSGVESAEVDTSVMAFEDKFNNSVGVSKHVCLVIRASHLLFEGHRSRGRVFLSKSGNIPHTHRLVKRGGHDQILLGVELRTPNI
jgi:hypothetical protein